MSPSNKKENEYKYNTYWVICDVLTMTDIK